MAVVFRYARRSWLIIRLTDVQWKHVAFYDWQETDALLQIHQQVWSDREGKVTPRVLSCDVIFFSIHKWKIKNTSVIME